MKVVTIRPARVQAQHVDWGDMLVSSPIGENEPKDPRWIGTVVAQIESPIDGDNPDREYRQWRIKRVDGQIVESKPVPADSYVWVHLPSSSV